MIYDYQLCVSIKEEVASGEIRKGKLLLDERALTVTIGGSRLFSSEVIPDDLIWYVLSLNRISALSWVYQGVAKPHVHITPKTSFSGNTEGLRLRMDNHEYFMLTSRFNSWKEAFLNKILDSSWATDTKERLILGTFRSSERVNLRQFAGSNKLRLWQCVEPNSKSIVPGFDDEDASEVLNMLVLEYTRLGKLNGLLDQANQEYVDRDFVVKQQKIVNVNLSMDFNALMQQLGNKGISLTSIQCPTCGTSCALPSSGSRITCEACKNNIEVMDVFEKFRGFLT